MPKMPASHAAVREYADTLSACSMFLVPPKLGASASMISARMYTEMSASTKRSTACPRPVPIGMRSVHAGADQCYLKVCAGAQQGAAVRPVIGINIDLVGDLVIICQLAQPGAQFVVIRPAGILDAYGGVEFVGGLAAAHSGHIHHHQFAHFGREAGGGAVTDFFKITEKQVCGLSGLQPGGMHGLHGGCKAGDAGFVVQVAGANEPVGYFDARIEGHEIADLDAKRAGFRLAGGAFVQPDLEGLSVSFHARSFRAVNVAGGCLDEDAAANLD